MADEGWANRSVLVASLQLDEKNPRLGRETSIRAPREIIQYLFEHDKAMEVAESIALRGFFLNEPLLAVRENEQLVVVEGNRRLAALKALREPGLLEGVKNKQIGKLSRRLNSDISKVPVTIAPNRRATDKQISGRHIGTPVLAWQAENRASFILDKLAEGYDNDELRDELGFTLADIQKARQTRAIADMARSLNLPPEIKAKLDNPRAKVFTTLERVFDSTVGQEYLHIQKDADDGIAGLTTKGEFLKGFTKLVTDVAVGDASSRTLNNNEDIANYFNGWDAKDRPLKKRGSFVPADVISGKSVASPATPKVATSHKKSKQASLTVLPRDFKIRSGNDRLIDIRRELTKIKRRDLPNAGAVLLRVFFELSVMHYLSRTGELSKITTDLKAKGKQLPYGTPTMKQLVPSIIRIAKAHLSVPDALKVEKALKYDSAAPFTLSDLHAFVHQTNDMPTDKDIQQFWMRTEPLFRMMLEQEAAISGVMP